MMHYNYLFNCRCLESIGLWTDLNNTVTSQWLRNPESNRIKMSKMAAAATWRLKQWSQMAIYVECIDKKTLDGVFYRAVLSIHDEQYDYAQKV